MKEQVGLLKHTLVFLIFLLLIVYAVLYVPLNIFHHSPLLVRRTRLRRSMVLLSARLSGIEAQIDRLNRLDRILFQLDSLRVEKERTADKLWTMGVDVDSLILAKEQAEESKILWFPD